MSHRCVWGAGAHRVGACTKGFARLHVCNIHAPCEGQPMEMHKWSWHQKSNIGRGGWDETRRKVINIPVSFNTRSYVRFPQEIVSIVDADSFCLMQQSLSNLLHCSPWKLKLCRCEQDATWGGTPCLLLIWCFFYDISSLLSVARSNLLVKMTFVSSPFLHKKLESGEKLAWCFPASFLLRGRLIPLLRFAKSKHVWGWQGVSFQVQKDDVGCHGKGVPRKYTTRPKLLQNTKCVCCSEKAITLLGGDEAFAETARLAARQPRHVDRRHCCSLHVTPSSEQQVAAQGTSLYEVLLQGQHWYPGVVHSSILSEQSFVLSAFVFWPHFLCEKSAKNATPAWKVDPWSPCNIIFVSWCTLRKCSIKREFSQISFWNKNWANVWILRPKDLPVFKHRLWADVIQQSWRQHN